MNATFTWEPPLSSWISRLSRFQNGQFESVGRLAEDAKGMLLEQMQAAAPKRTGQYASDIRATRQVDGKGERVTVYGTSPLSAYIIKGTQPHLILPVNAKALRFEPAGGGVVFARRVNHPGTRPNDFPQTAYQAAHGELVARLQQTGRELVEELRT